MTAALLGAGAAPPLPPPPISPAFARDSVWDDGRTEVVTYSTARRGQQPFESHITLRKEIGRGPVLTPGGEAAARKPEALAMTYTWSLTAGADTARREALVLFDRKTFRVTKVSVSMRKAGRDRRADAVPRGTKLVCAGERTLTLPWGADGVFYDALPVWLRGLDLTMPARFRVRLLPELLAGADTSLVPAEIEIVGSAGGFSETGHGGLEADVRYEGKVDKLWFHPGRGHVLMAWDRPDSTELTLEQSRRE